MFLKRFRVLSKFKVIFEQVTWYFSHWDIKEEGKVVNEYKFTCCGGRKSKEFLLLGFYICYNLRRYIFSTKEGHEGVHGHGDGVEK